MLDSKLLASCEFMIIRPTFLGPQGVPGAPWLAVYPHVHALGQLFYAFAFGSEFPDQLFSAISNRIRVLKKNLLICKYD